MRRKTNIVRLEDCRIVPCKEWLKRFKNGQIDIHKAFKKYGAHYDWLYANTDIDLVGWQIENNYFDWEKYSWAVAKYCPHLLKLNPIRNKTQLSPAGLKEQPCKL